MKLKLWLKFLDFTRTAHILPGLPDDVTTYNLTFRPCHRDFIDGRVAWSHDLRVTVSERSIH